MAELLNVWREIGALVRFAEAKNTFLTALLITYLSVAHSKEWASGQDNYVFLILFGGNQRVFLPFIAMSTVLSAISILPVTSTGFVFLKYRRRLPPDRPPIPTIFATSRPQTAPRDGCNRCKPCRRRTSIAPNSLPRRS